MRFVHFADLHLGYENYGQVDSKTGLNSRLIDFLSAFDELVDFACDKKNKVDLVVFAGDAYKTRDPSPTYVKEFAKRIKKIAENKIPVVLLVGNHDLPVSHGRANTLEIFPALKVPNVFVSSRPEILKIILPKTKTQIQIATFPWVTKGQIIAQNKLTGQSIEKIDQLVSAKISQLILGLAKKIDKNIPNIFLGHLSVTGAMYSSEQKVMLGTDLVVPLEILKRTKFDYIALGHLHKHQVLLKKPLTIYSGGLERIDFGEEKEPKGFVVVDILKNNNITSVDYKFIKTKARKFLNLNFHISENETDPTNKIIKKIINTQPKDAIVKITINASERKFAEIEISKIQTVLQSAFFVASITKNYTDTFRKKSIRFYEKDLSILDMLDQWCKDKKITKMRRVQLKKYARKLLEESNI